MKFRVMRNQVAVAIVAALLPRWSSVPLSSSKYTLIVPVPSDLPAFSALASSALQRQDLTHANQVIVVWDGRPESSHLFSGVEGVDVQHVAPTGLLFAVLRFLSDPGKNHAAQLVLGVNEARSSICVLHDADAIPISEKFFEKRFSLLAASGDLALGVQPLWDADLRLEFPWLVATWELAFCTTWLKSFSPSTHFAHLMRVTGGRRLVDTTVAAQIRSDPSRIRSRSETEGFVHLNYVVSTFRKYARSSRPFMDDSFRLLFIRLLTDVLTPGASINLPAMRDFQRSLTGGSSGVVFPSACAGKDRYVTFRTEVLRGIRHVYGDDSRELRDTELQLVAFDQFYLS